MRTRLLGAVAALLGCAAFAAAQTAPPLPAPGVQPAPVPAVQPAPGQGVVPGMTPVPVLPPASLPAPPAVPPVMASNPNCGTPAVAACNTCGKPAKKACGGLLSKFLIGPGTATPVTCGCLAAERTFMFGSCKQFFTPGRTCNGCNIEYGPGGMGYYDNCKNVGSFINR